jgi:hypothetical protein
MSTFERVLYISACSPWERATLNPSYCTLFSSAFISALCVDGAQNQYTHRRTCEVAA